MIDCDVVFWSSKTGNTRRFVKMLGLGGYEIGRDAEMVSRPFYLVMPTFADADGSNAVPKPIIRFLNIEKNRSRLLGVIGGGNRNFGEMFAIGSRVVAYKCGVPLIHKFELAGTEADVREVKKRLLNK